MSPLSGSPVIERTLSSRGLPRWDYEDGQALEQLFNADNKQVLLIEHGGFVGFGAPWAFNEAQQVTLPTQQ